MDGIEAACLRRGMDDSAVDIAKISMVDVKGIIQSPRFRERIEACKTVPVASRLVSKSSIVVSSPFVLFQIVVMVDIAVTATSDAGNTIQDH